MRGDRPRRPVEGPDTTTKYWLFGGLAGLAVLGGYVAMRRGSKRGIDLKGSR